MKNTFINHSCKALALSGVLAMLSLLPTSYGQQGPQAAALGLDRGSELVLNEPGQVLELGDGRVIEGDVILSGAGCDIIVHPGVQTISGNVQVNGSNDHILFEFSEEKENGQLHIEGTLELGPDNSPLLSLDLSRTHLAKGDIFTIVSAGQIVGEFKGMGNGDTLKLGDYAVQVSYDANSITLLVVKAPKRPHPRITPIIDMETDLIDPTSTAPAGHW